MPPRRTTSTWWNHAAGQSAITSAAQPQVRVYSFSGGTSDCYHNIYGIMPLQQHGGSYPGAFYNTAGNTTPGDWCMAVGVQLGSTSVDGFSQNGNGYDGPASETDWSNANYTSTPFLTVWLR